MIISVQIQYAVVWGSTIQSCRFTTMPFWLFIWGKIVEIVATRGQVLRLICTKFYFGAGALPIPHWGTYSAPQNS